MCNLGTVEPTSPEIPVLTGHSAHAQASLHSLHATLLFCAFFLQSIVIGDVTQNLLAAGHRLTPTWCDVVDTGHCG